MVGRLSAALCMLLLIAAPDAFGQDEFDLSDAVGGDENKPTEKPQPAQPTQPGLSGGGHAVTEKKPTVKPQPAQPGAGGGDGVTEKKPTVKPQPAQPAHPGAGGGDGGFNLEDAMGGDEKEPTEKPKPAQPGQGGGAGGNFGDDDLADGMPPHNPSGGDTRPRGRAMQPSTAGEEEGGQGQGEEKQSVIAGVVSALSVAAVGAISSFIAYQKKKLCFKGQAADDPENVNMDAHKGDQNDPQAQSNLLEK